MLSLSAAALSMFNASIRASSNISPRNEAIIRSMEEISLITPDVKAEDLAAAFEALAVSRNGDTPQVGSRRKTCADIACALTLAGLRGGNSAGALPWFQAQIDTWSGTTDPRLAAMVGTAQRELSELSQG